MPETACKGRKHAATIHQIVHNYIAYLYEYEKKASQLNCSKKITLNVKHDAKKKLLILKEDIINSHPYEIKHVMFSYAQKLSIMFYYYEWNFANNAPNINITTI